MLRGYAFKVGGEIDLVFDEDLKVIYDSELNFYGGTMALILSNMIDVYTELGVANGKFEETYDSNKVRWETDTAFAWCIGSMANSIRRGISNR